MVDWGRLGKAAIGTALGGPVGGLAGYFSDDIVGGAKEALSAPEISWKPPELDPKAYQPTGYQERLRGQAAQQAGALGRMKGPEQVQMGAMPQFGDPRAAQIGAMDPRLVQAQEQVMQRLQARASGQVASAAEMQQKQAMEDVRRQMLSAAATGRGAQVGASLQAQQGQMAQASQQAAAQAAILRAQEQERAEGMLAQEVGRQQQLAQQRATAQAGLEQEAALTGYRADVEAGLLGQKLGVDVSKFNVQQKQDFIQFVEQGKQKYLAMGMDAAEADRRAAIDAQEMVLRQSGLGLQAETAKAGLEAQMKGAGISAVAGLGAAVPGIIAAASDERLKKDKKRQEKELKEFLDSLKGYKYRYKDPERHGEGDFVGIMAQDAEKSKVGQTFVLEQPEGKHVDVVKMAMATLAAASHLNKRVNKLEGRNG